MATQCRLTANAAATILGVLVALLAGPTAALAATNPFDPTFGHRGVVVTNQANGVVLDLAEDHRGRVVAAGIGGSGLLLARYLADGSLDPSFGRSIAQERLTPSPGIVSSEAAEGGAFGVAIQADGKIVAAGPEYLERGFGPGGGFMIVRYLPNGRPDLAFGKKGRVPTRFGLKAGGARALAIQRDGRIIVGGREETSDHQAVGLVIRYLPNGALDRGFGSGGILDPVRGDRDVTGVSDVRTLADGSVLVAGSIDARLFVAKLRPDGRPDPRFGSGDGRVTATISRHRPCDACPNIQSLAVTPGGGLVLAASLSGNSGVFRFDAAGHRLHRFGTDGLVRLRRMSYFGAARDVTLTADGRILVVGGTEFAGAVFRLLPDGRRDPSFAHGGALVLRRGIQLCASLSQRDGRVLLAGRSEGEDRGLEASTPLDSAHFLLARLRP
jgi:uncharacterized delta-60 repeat protein